MPSRREARQHLGTQDFICSITLPVFHGTPITGREEEDLLLPNHLSEIVIKIACFIGGNDPTVVPQHALSFLKECIKYGTQPDFFIYPGEPHNMRGHQSVHLHERISRYFFDFLK